MRAPAFWYASPGILAFLLSPLAALYQFGSQLRRVVATPYQAKIPVICVGNSVAGGAGKTPVALALADILLSRGASPVFVTRGYGGRERGPLKVDLARHTALDVGDEALLLARHAPVFIGVHRAATVKFAESQGTHIILDDGLQNPTLKPDIAFLVMDGRTGLGNGHTLPSGPLREPLPAALLRTTALIIVGDDPPAFLKDCGRPVFLARLEPILPKDFPRQHRFIAFAGIGRPEKFFASCADEKLTIVGQKIFADHHFYRSVELKELRQWAEREHAQLLTTEKDWVRLPDDIKAITQTLPVKIVFADPAAIAALLP